MVSLHVNNQVNSKLLGNIRMRALQRRAALRTTARHNHIAHSSVVPVVIKESYEWKPSTKQYNKARFIQPSSQDSPELLLSKLEKRKLPRQNLCRI